MSKYSRFMFKLNCLMGGVFYKRKDVGKNTNIRQYRVALIHYIERIFTVKAISPIRSTHSFVKIFLDSN